MSRILLLFIILASFFAQARPLVKPLPCSNHSSLADTTRKNKQPAFYLQYKCSMLGFSVIIPSQPVLIVKGSRFRFMYQRNSYFRMNGKRVDKEIEMISQGLLRQSSIDSIISLVAFLKDSTIERINPFVMSGNIHLLTIVNGADTTKFKLTNTFDYTALKIVNILNQYLPADKRIWASEELIKQEKESWEWFNEADKKEKKKKDSINATTNKQLL